MSLPRSTEPSGRSFQTLVDLYRTSVREFADRPLFGTKRDGAWTWMTYREFGARVDALRGGLASLGIKAGDRVAAISTNRVEWAVGAYATYTLGAAYAPMYESQQPREWEYILRDCGARVVLVASEAIATQVRAMQPQLPALEHVVTMEGPAGKSSGLDALEVRGRSAPAPSPIVDPGPAALAGLIYTSGTTGEPKGVMLTHANLAGNVTAMNAVFPMATEDRSLSFLPWGHSFGQVVELHGLFSMGASMAIAESVDKIIDNLSEVKPTLLFSVPRIFNRIYEGLQRRMATESAVKRALFARLLKVAARRRQLAEQGKEGGPLLRLQHRLLDRVVASKVRARFGGNLRYAFSGGAAISREVAEFIDDLGITVYEGYGLTETSPIATANWPGNRRIGSVGRPIPGTRVSIDRSADTDDGRSGEVVVHGHNVMKGYYNLPQEDAKVFTADGGFRTGDLGYVDADGFLHITGRIKEQYKLENGKYVAPVAIEEALKLSPFITSAFVHGQNRPYNVAVLVPELESLKTWARAHGLGDLAPEALLTHPDVVKLFTEQVATYTRELKSFERPQRFVLVAEDFSTANDLLTPKLSLKRRNILARYGAALEALYTAGGDVRAA